MKNWSHFEWEKLVIWSRCQILILLCGLLQQHYLRPYTSHLNFSNSLHMSKSFKWSNMCSLSIEGTFLEKCFWKWAAWCSPQFSVLMLWFLANIIQNHLFYRNIMTSQEAVDFVCEKLDQQRKNGSICLSKICEQVCDRVKLYLSSELKSF